MDAAKRQELYREIDTARRDEDRAWAVAAEMRRRHASEAELIGAIQLVEATTANRIKLEHKLREAQQSE
ncbi:MAG: hypothetical protein K0R58_220 [Ramlibacter sp.]|jgi:hypothetical protein|nr:hypothetical protein [Ramlibacter sp.]